MSGALQTATMEEAEEREFVSKEGEEQAREEEEGDMDEEEGGLL